MIDLDSDSLSTAGFGTTMKRKYTCIPDFNSAEKNLRASYHRGRLMFMGITASTPSSASIDTAGWRVHDQEQEQSCVGYATSTVREHYANLGVNPAADLSPLFIYWWARKLDNVTYQDGGSRIINAMTCLKDYGVCEEQYHKSIAGTNRDVFLCPDTVAMVSAKKYSVTGFSGLTTLDELKVALAAGNPIVAGIPVYESMETSAVSKTGTIPIPSAKEKLLGGHAIALIGYDDATQLVKFHNSWGIGWGDKGCGYIPYGFLLTNYFDAWEMSC